MHRSPLFVLSLVLGVAAAPIMASADDTIRIPGTHVSLAPPAGFALSKRFAGVEDEQRLASIVVREIETAAAELSEGLTEAQLSPRGLALKESEAATFGSRAGQLVRVEQTIKGKVYEKWMAVVGDDARSILLVATFPTLFSAQLRDELRSAVLSAAWQPDLDLGPFDGLSFRLDAGSSLEIVHRSRNGVALTTTGGQFPVADGEPLLLVADSYGPMALEDLMAFSRERLSQLGRVTGVGADQGRELTVGGRDAFELIADAKSAGSGTAVRVYQVVVPSPGGYTVVQGQAPVDAADELIAAFRGVTDSLEFSGP